mgnify:CR=1 FL=1
MGDSSRNVVEIIFRTSWMTAAATGGRKDMQVLQVTGAVKIERVLKVNNLPRTLARFEAYRDGVKMKAGKLIPKKHPRCLADGNELLRFYAAKLECGLVSSIEAASNPSGEYKTNDMNAASRSGTPPSSLPFGAACSSPTCSICRIIRSGFSKSRAPDGSNRGILTTATSGRAHDILQQKMTSSGESLSNNNYGTGRNLMAMLVCRVIAGRVQKPAASGVLDTVGFDSVAGGDTSVASTSSSHYSLTEAAAVGLHSRFEELTVFSPRAILPCFVVLYSCAANKP